MLQILSLAMFERILLDRLLNNVMTEDILLFPSNQLNLFEKRPDTTAISYMAKFATTGNTYAPTFDNALA